MFTLYEQQIKELQESIKNGGGERNSSQEGGFPMKPQAIALIRVYPYCHVSTLYIRTLYIRPASVFF